jgi:ribosomal protein S28E/S33
MRSPGRKLAVAFALGDEERAVSSADEGPASEEDVLELMKSTFDARELEI